MATIVRARSKTVYARSNFGQFARECDAAATRTARKLAQDGAKASRALAPSGERRDTRPGHTKLKKSIKWKMTGSASAEWYSTSKHALHVEFGTSAHDIIGKLGFPWHNDNGFFVWNDWRYGPYGSGKPYENWGPGGAVVHHPGAGAQPFLLPAYAMIARKALPVAKREYPG